MEMADLPFASLSQATLASTAPVSDSSAETVLFQQENSETTETPPTGTAAPLRAKLRLGTLAPTLPASATIEGMESLKLQKDAMTETTVMETAVHPNVWKNIVVMTSYNMI